MPLRAFYDMERSSSFSARTTILFGLPLMIYAVVRFVYDFLSGAGRAQTAPSCNEVTVTLKVTVTCINNRQAAARQPKPLTQKRLAEGCPAGCLHPPACVLMPSRAFYDLEQS